MKRLLAVSFFTFTLLAVPVSQAADTVPNEVQLPGTQPLEIGNLESPNKCDNCHGGYNSSVEPAHNWRGSMMAHAGRDPIFWATMAIAEQDFDGAGDLCIRCHSTAGWLAGRSTPTDGSGLAAGDSDGVECDYCHKLTNPDDTEHQGVMNGSFVANETNGGETEGYYGSGMSSMWGGSDKLGPYNNADARHKFMQSEFHRDRNFCGTCHDVSNSVTGDLAHNRGALFDNGANVIASDEPGSGVDQKAAFNNPPYRYGIVERTFSEFKSGAISSLLLDDYGDPANPRGLPDDLKGGALEAAYNAAFDPGTGSANYQNPPAPRYFSCQTCHMRAVTGKGANKHGVPTRVDLALHDMTGGNYWMAEAIRYLDERGKLRLGGGMSQQLLQAMDDGALRAREQLELAASLEVIGDTVRIVNHSGHKLITGYPEGRRMWLNIEWLDANGQTLRIDGEYGGIGVQAGGTEVQSILDLEGTNTRIYEAHMGMTSEWAAQLLGLGVPGDLPLKYDRVSGAVVEDLAGLAARPAGTVQPTFHFVLNNTVFSDNRIPPYGMNANTAAERNAMPVAPDPAEAYPVDADGNYPYFDIVPIKPHPDAVSAEITLLYQPTSWEYVQFLDLANDGSVAFLADEGSNMLEAWLNTGMAEPFEMAEATWGTEPPEPGCELGAPNLDSAVAGQGQVALQWTGPAAGGHDGFTLYYDQSDKAQKIVDLPCTGPCTSHTDTGVTNGNEYCYKVTATAESPECESGFSNILCATPQPSGETIYAAVSIAETGRWVRIGKGNNAYDEWQPGSQFAPGHRVHVRVDAIDQNGLPVADATVDLTISGPETVTITSAASDADGRAEASWSTSAPKKKGNGGTPEGAYSVSVSGLASSTHEWDGSSASVTIWIDSAAAASHHRMKKR